MSDFTFSSATGDRHDLYGNQRKWGSIGWGLFTLFSGFLVDLVSGDSLIKNYTPCFWVAGILLTLNFYVCWKWDVRAQHSRIFFNELINLLNYTIETMIFFL